VGCIQLFRDQVQAGKPYIGCSAGSIVAGPDIAPARNLADVEKVPRLHDTSGLGIVDLIIFPHWGSADFRESYMDFRMQHAYEAQYKTVLLNDSQYMGVSNDGWYRIVDTRSDDA
jgi:dipeptidase E